MKSVLASIQPQYCELIASGKKTVELRKTRPKIDTPFKVYIYQTKTVYISKSKENDLLVPIKQNMGKVIGEFVCDEIVDWDVTSVSPSRIPNSFVIDGCLSPTEICEYAYKGRKGLHGWHISDLVIYDKPRELSEFVPSCHRLIGDMENTCDGICGCEHQRIDRNPDGKINTFICENRIQRPPQSWCYVEEV